jgi:hypothetical protein
MSRELHTFNCKKCGNIATEVDDYDDYEQQLTVDGTNAKCFTCKSDHLLCDECMEPMRLVSHEGFFDTGRIYWRKLNLYTDAPYPYLDYCLTNNKKHMIPQYTEKSSEFHTEIQNYKEEYEEKYRFLCRPDECLYYLTVPVYYHCEFDPLFLPEPKVFLPEIPIDEAMIYKIYDYMGLSLLLHGPDGGMPHDWCCDNKECTKHGIIISHTNK